MLAGLMTGGYVGQAGEVVVNNFDSEEEVAAWYWENWSDPAEVSFDATLDAGGGAGSLRVVNNFPDRPTGYSQSVVTVPLGGDVDAETLYTKLSLDIKVDPSSALRANGANYGQFEVIFRNGSDWTWNSLAGFALTDTNNWVHLEFPVKAPGDKVHHLTLKLGENNLTNTVIYNVDNIRWTEATVQVPPPTMSIEKAKPGLNLMAGTPGQWDRQNIKTVPTGLGWIGVTEPVSYSMTIKEFPDGKVYPDFRVQMFLVPGTPGTENSPDWNEAAAIIFGVQVDTNNVGTAIFRYKTDAPGSNGGYFNTDPSKGQVGELGGVTGDGIVGTWTVTFAQDNQITLKAPNGTTTSLVMPAEDAAKFAGDITVYYGIIPNQTANIGQAAILNGAKIMAGSTVLLEDTFASGTLNPETWTVNASLAACVSVVTPKDPYWVWWTTPASGFILQTNADVTPLTWGTPDPALTDALVGSKKRALITEAAVPALQKGFFRLVKPAE